MLIKISKYSMLRGAILYVSLLLLCSILLFVSFSLQGNIEDNARAGITKITEETLYPKILEEYLPVPWTWLLSSWAHYLQQDNFTDREMLKAAVSEGEDIFERAMIPEYGRYWHGYLIFLRPLLLVFSYEELKYVGLLFHISGLSLLYFAVRNHSFFVAKGLIFSLVLYGWLTAWLSLTFYAVYGIVYIAGTLATRIREENLPFLFFLSGMLTAFFDLLSTPLLTLGIPLLVLYSREDMLLLRRMFLYCAVWGGGYALFWLAKPVIAAFVLQQDIIADFWYQVVFRIAGSDPQQAESSVWYQAFVMNGRVLMGLVPVFWYFRKKLAWSGRYGIPLLFIGSLPIFWILVLANHSAIHYWFVARIFTISSFALFVYLDKLDKDARDEKVSC